MKAELAWPAGDRPDRFGFSEEPPARVADAVLHALLPVLPDAAGGTLRAIAPCPTPVGRFRLEAPSGRWFVKVSARERDLPLEQALVDTLASAGVPVSRPVVAGVPVPWPDVRLTLEARPFVDGHHWSGNDAELAALARTLRAGHAALATFPMATAVRAAASVRARRLDAARVTIARAVARRDFSVFGVHAAWASAQVDWLAELAGGFTTDLAELAGAQCVHGEVHPANVLFRSDDGVAVLLDFEESVRLFSPVAWDLAWVAQRFCLADEPEPAVLGGRLAILRDAYGEALPPLAPMMRRAAWLSIATVVDLAGGGVVTAESELAKFVRLERQARALDGVV